MLHEWSLEQNEVERHRARRGRIHAFETIDPRRAALVVIDMVPFFAESNRYARGIVPNIRRLADSMRAAGGIVVWVVPSDEPPPAARVEFLGVEVAEAYRTSGRGGAPRDRIWCVLAPEPDDLVVEKSAMSAFFPGRCELPARLDALEIDTVLIGGTVANVCCESSARDASTLGYRVIMVADANAAGRDQDLNATLHTIYRSFGDVRSTDDVIRLIGSRRDR